MNKGAGSGSCPRMRSGPCLHTTGYSSVFKQTAFCACENMRGRLAVQLFLVISVCL